MAHTVRGEERCDRRRPKRGPAIGEEALRSASSARRCEDASDLLARSPAELLEGDEAAAMVVDDAQDPDGDEAEDEDEGEVGAPELTGASDADPLRPPASRLPEAGHEVPAADEDAAEGLAGRVEGEDPSGDHSQLARSEVSLLHMEPDYLLLDVIRGAVPRAVPAEGRRRREAMAEKPARVEAAQRATPLPDPAREPPPVVVDEEGEPEEELDDGEADPFVGA